MPDPQAAESPKPRSIGFVGLGNMGIPMARRLAAAGYAVHGYDVSSDARRRASDAGVAVVSSLGEAAASDLVILMLPSSAIVSLVLDDAEFIASIRPGTLVVDMGSSEPGATRTASDQLARRSGRLLDAPVSGGVGGAEAGRLTIMVGGSADDLNEARPLLECLGRTVHAGPIGAGDAVKALNNLLSAAHLWVTSEAMLVGQRFGIEPQVLLDVFNSSSGRSGSTENKWPNFILPGTFDSGFALQLMLKDMRIATQLARDCGVPSRLGEAAVSLWSEASSSLDAGADHTEVALYLQEAAGPPADQADHQAGGST
ncbi:NAD(P)-dependent oxidoreductase [Nocardioides sp.]|uniref:NAD(P)-dependent oxidoreductase n=1 Tax=Nocardioides sp. TaxID=35761 RepID=UPI003D146749